jgi:hypothetical protein
MTVIRFQIKVRDRENGRDKTLLVDADTVTVITVFILKNKL